MKKKLALKSHIGARQLEDLRHDLALRIKPSDGPYSSGDKVFVWVKDHSKIKDSGCWERARVLSQQGPIITVEDFQDYYEDK